MTHNTYRIIMYCHPHDTTDGTPKRIDENTKTNISST